MCRRVVDKRFQRRGKLHSRGGGCFVRCAERAPGKYNSRDQYCSVLIHHGTGPHGLPGRSPADRCPDHLALSRSYFPHLVQRRRNPPSGVLSASQWCPILSLHSRARIMTTPLREVLSTVSCPVECHSWAVCRSVSMNGRRWQTYHHLVSAQPFRAPSPLSPSLPQRKQRVYKPPSSACSTCQWCRRFSLHSRAWIMANSDLNRNAPSSNTGLQAAAREERNQRA